MEWADYEEEVFKVIKFIEEYSNPKIKTNVEKNCQIIGKHTNIKRQVDIIVEKEINGYIEKTAIECKFYNKKINVKQIEMFIGMLGDLNLDSGILITNKGYSKGAIERAYNDPYNITVDIMNFEEFKEFQSDMAFPYAGEDGVILVAPFGWVIDGTRREGMVASMYQRGKNFDDAIKSGEYMYINFWDKKDEEINTLEKLIELQNNNILSFSDANAIISIIEEKETDYKRILIRKVELKGRKKIIEMEEYTGFIDFKEYVFFCVLSTHKNMSVRNIYKLKQVLSMVLPIGIIRS